MTGLQHEKSRPGEKAAHSKNNDSETILPAATDFFDPHHFLAAWDSATRRFWRTKADVWLQARPQPQDFHGSATPEVLAEQWDRLTAKANACLARAEMAERYGRTPADDALIVGVATVLAAA